ncbi:MAG: hypothetical protein GY950_15145, partial [bacterium]|nr:hypothetical protein [bacterium]
VTVHSGPLSLSMEPRTGLAPGDAADCSQVDPAIATIPGPLLPIKEVGEHYVTVQARVVPDFTQTNLYIIIANGLKTEEPPGSGTDVKPSQRSGSQPSSTKNKAAAAWFRLLKRSALAPRIGLANPGADQTREVGDNPASGSSRPIRSVRYIDKKTLDKFQFRDISPAVSLNNPPLFTISTARGYRVNAADPEKPCSWWFPTTKGNFLVSNLQRGVKKENGKYNGKGMLILPLTNRVGVTKDYTIEIGIQNWEVDENSTIVTNGTIDVSPAEPANQIFATGVTGT